ncbi:MAG: RNA polymerase sigma factor [Acidimicrobiales bacterium]
MSVVPGPIEPAASSFLADIYVRALPEVYGYLHHRVQDASLAEDLTAETFLQAARSLREGALVAVTTPWLMTVARNRLIDHWRREAAADRALSAVASASNDAMDDWDVRLDGLRARDILRRLSTQHRAALTLRYLDGLGVAEVAELLGRTLHATEALLVRARAAFRLSYEDEGGDGDG